MLKEGDEKEKGGCHIGSFSQWPPSVMGNVIATLKQLVDVHEFGENRWPALSQAEEKETIDDTNGVEDDTI